eukprot:jgi/Botrbrau1/21721/Bobra.43_1s0115.1
MAELRIIAEFELPESTDPEEFIAKAKGAIEESRTHEGVKQYDLLRSQDDPRRFVMFERWESWDHVEMHLGILTESGILKWFQDQGIKLQIRKFDLVASIT